MFFDLRLWALTKTRATLLNVTIGVIASLAGIARLGLLGWLLSKVFNGATFTDLLTLMVLVGTCDQPRVSGTLAEDGGTRTAATVQLKLRSQLHDHVLQLGPQTGACTHWRSFAVLSRRR